MNCKLARIHYKLQFITKFTTIPKNWESGELLPVWVDNIDLGLLMVWFSWRHLYLQWICRNLIVPERPPSQKIWIWMSKASSVFSLYHLGRLCLLLLAILQTDGSMCGAVHCGVGGRACGLPPGCTPRAAHFRLLWHHPFWASFYCAHFEPTEASEESLDFCQKLL